MNHTLRTILIVFLALALAAGSFLGGMFFGAGHYGYNMMFAPGARGTGNGYGPYGMMGGYAYPGYDNAPQGYGPGMMGGYAGSPAGAKPLAIEDAHNAVSAYLARINDSDLQLKEIMIFDNGGYAVVSEKSTGVGAFELLIDPAGLNVYPEYGPSMMWNLKYGMMVTNGAFTGMNRGMMGRWYSNTPATAVSATMPVSAEQAAGNAQRYLDGALPGDKVSDEVTPFYGYYTIDFERDGKVAGMLSVNGYSGQVFLHTWHGTFVGASD